MPAMRATTALKPLGRLMNDVRMRSSKAKTSGTRSMASTTKVRTMVAATAKRKPHASVAAARPASRRWPRNNATVSALMGLKSGLTTIAPTMRIGESVRMPTAAITAAITMKTTRLRVSVASERARTSTSSQITASSGCPGAIASACSAARETVNGACCSATLPDSVSPSCSRASRSWCAASSVTSSSTRWP